MGTNDRTKKDILETIAILCCWLESERLEQVWKIVYVLAEEQWQAEREREKGTQVELGSLGSSG
jgi:hypothetical protein